MNNLIIFGCSHGKMGYVEKNNHHWEDKNSFGWFMAKNLNLKLINYSLPGSSNFHIFEKIYKNLENITNKDIVLVQWSYIDRAYISNDEYSVMPHHHDKNSKLYYKYLYNELQEINKVLGFTLMLDSIISNFYFNFCNGSFYLEKTSFQTFQLLKNKKNFLNINKQELSNEFSNNLIDGFHLSVTGQKILSQKYIDKILY
jgi:hypothetical protein